MQHMPFRSSKVCQKDSGKPWSLGLGPNPRRFIWLVTRPCWGGSRANHLDLQLIKSSSITMRSITTVPIAPHGPETATTATHSIQLQRHKAWTTSQFIWHRPAAQYLLVSRALLRQKQGHPCGPTALSSLSRGKVKAIDRRWSIAGIRPNLRVSTWLLARPC